MFWVYRKIQTEELIKMSTQYSREPIECKNCHEQFTPSNIHQIYCSKECMVAHDTQKGIVESEEKFNSGRGKVYSLDMSSWSWKKKQLLEESIEKTKK